MVEVLLMKVARPTVARIHPRLWLPTLIAGRMHSRSISPDARLISTSTTRNATIGDWSHAASEMSRNPASMVRSP